MKIDINNKTTKIKLLILDVDGVLTDGSVYVDRNGNEMLKFSRIDGRGIYLLKEKGLKTAVITSEDSEIVKARMKKLRIDEIYVNIEDKIKVYNEIKKKQSLEDKNICFLADDTQDLEVLKLVGLSCCPLNAQKIVKEHSIYKSPFKGGKGFVRDVCNLIIENLQE